jgi:hypothetical protein
LGVKNIGPKQKANYTRWINTNLLKDKRFKEEFFINQDGYFLQISAAKKIAENYLKKRNFKENAEKVLKDLASVSNLHQSPVVSNGLTEGTEATHYMSIDGTKKYWTAWGISKFCGISSSEWDTKTRTDVSCTLERFMKSKYNGGEIRRTVNGVSAYPIAVWAMWLGTRLERGDKIEGSFKKLLGGLYSIHSYFGPFTNDFISWQKYLDSLSPKDHTKRRLKNSPSFSTTIGAGKLISCQNNVSFEDVRNQLANIKVSIDQILSVLPKMA